VSFWRENAFTPFGFIGARRKRVRMSVAVSALDQEDIPASCEETSVLTIDNGDPVGSP